MSAALALCASSRAIDVAIRHAGSDVVVPAGDDLPPDLASRVAALCEAENLAPAEIDEVRVDVGPGSYTGLRVAVTFARTLHAFRGALLRRATSFELMALAAVPAGETRTLDLVLDARRGRWHHTRVTVGDGIEVVVPAAAVDGATLGTRLADAGDVLVEASARATFAERIGRPAGAAPPARAAALFDARLHAPEVDVAGLQPLYLMGSYADEPMA